MKIGVGLPTTIPGVRGDHVLTWAKRAEELSFDGLGIIDRLTFPNYDPLVTLGAVAGATQRIGLMTTILVAPLRNTGILAKELATLDVLSDGRLKLGMAVSSRRDDYHAAPAAFTDRGRRFEAQIETMRRLWAGEAYDDQAGPIGPPPIQDGGPPILIGAGTPAGLRRIARIGDGYIAGAAGPDMAGKFWSTVEDAWRQEERSGNPQFVATTYFTLGPNAEDRAYEYFSRFYAYLPQMVPAFAREVACTPDDVVKTVQGFADIGVQELYFMPCGPGLHQLERLADVVARVGAVLA